jgi:hypothetical protein
LRASRSCASISGRRSGPYAESGSNAAECPGIDRDVLGGEIDIGVRVARLVRVAGLKGLAVVKRRILNKRS